MKVAGVLFVIFVIACIAWPIFYAMTYVVPADVAFAKKFGSRYEMAMDQADFIEMRNELVKIWNTMNDTWRGEDFDTVYNSWWFGDQTYINSLAAQNSYFNSLIRRIDQTITEKEMILNGSKSIIIPYSQWEQQTLQSLRNETQRSGGLLWVIRDAWYMRFAPMVAFWPFYFLLIWLILIVLAGISLLFAIV